MKKAVIVLFVLFVTMSGCSKYNSKYFEKFDETHSYLAIYEHVATRNIVLNESNISLTKQLELDILNDKTFELLSFIGEIENEAYKHIDTKSEIINYLKSDVIDQVMFNDKNYASTLKEKLLEYKYYLIHLCGENNDINKKIEELINLNDPPIRITGEVFTWERNLFHNKNAIQGIIILNVLKNDILTAESLVLIKMLNKNAP